MDAQPYVSEADRAATPPAVLALLVWQSEQIATLTARLVDLEDQFARWQGKTPANSSQPPSSTHPHDKPPPKNADRDGKDQRQRQRGGQPGHDQHERPLLPSQACARVVALRPDQCRKCGKALAGIDPAPLRHQVWELPEIQPLVTEYQRHRLVCSCGCRTCGQLPAGVPTGQAGPRLIAFAAVLMACFRQSKRRAAWFMSTILNQPASPAWMVSLQNRAAAAVKPAYDELAAQLPQQATLNIDESPTKQATSKAWVWTFVAASFTFFACRTSRAADVLQELLGAAYAGVVGCDRARMYWCLGPGGKGRLQWCWAHLQRDFQALIDGPCRTGQRLGHDRMRPTKAMFSLGQKVRDGTLSHRAFRRRMKPIRAKIDALVLRGRCNPRTHGFCKELGEHKAHLWTFVDIEGIEPTNNAAERALRHAVIWRKLSFGTQSANGSRFVERLLTVVETCRRQNRNAFAWLADAVQSHLERRPMTSLLPAQ
jgi:transposase